MSIALLLPCASASAQESPRQAGERLRSSLAEGGLRRDLSGVLRLSVQVGDSDPVGTLVLRTDLLERDGQPIYRLTDRLSVELAGLGSVRMLVRADLLADFTPLELVLETEEPRGEGVVSSERVTLRREEGRWVRYVAQASAPPVRTVLEDAPDDLLVLTPPLGAGERLARLAPADLGARYSLRALDLETGLSTAWRLSVDDAATVHLGEGQERPGLALARREGAAELRALRDREPGGALRRLIPAGERPRLRFVDPALRREGTALEGAEGAVAALLHALARGHRAQALERLDVGAVYRAAGGDSGDHGLRRTFADVLLDRLSDPEWLQARGLNLAADAVGEGDLVARPLPDGRVAVAPTTAPHLPFVVEQVDGRWLVVDLPRPE